MARTRFAPDSGLTVRMTSVMFLLGAVFVALVVVLMFVLPAGWAPIIGVIGIGIAWGQWYFSDTVAMKAMRAREVTPEEAPELHAMIDRLCALADMPKPRVGVADMSVPNAFATGRSPERSVVCVTTGILGLLTADEMEAVLAHELSHVAHRDVTVMTIASTAGIVAGMLTRGAQYGALFGGGRRDNDNNGAPGLDRRPGRQPRGLRHQLLPDPAALALPRAVRRPVGRLPDHEAAGAGHGAAEDLRRHVGRPGPRPARLQLDERLLHRPGDQGREPRAS